MTDAVIPPENTAPTDKVGALRALQESLRDCNQCGLCSGRTQVVFGVGSPCAELLFVGEGPGFHEDKQGEPFVGAAGKLLNTLLGQIDLSRADIYIANVVKCRPPENRDPTESEIAACSPHLMAQIGIIRPRVICTLGRFATRLLTGTELSMTAVHGKAKPLELGGVNTIVFPVFHPAAALYAPANRVVLEEDFAKLRRLLRRGAAALHVEQGVAAAQADVVDPASAVAPAPAATSGCGSGEATVNTTRKPASPPEAREQQAGGSSEAKQLPLW
jgi:DNA polymerase